MSISLTSTSTSTRSFRRSAIRANRELAIAPSPPSAATKSPTSTFRSSTTPLIGASTSQSRRAFPAAASIASLADSRMRRPTDQGLLVSKPGFERGGVSGWGGLSPADPWARECREESDP